MNDDPYVGKQNGCIVDESVHTGELLEEGHAVAHSHASSRFAAEQAKPGQDLEL